MKISPIPVCLLLAACSAVGPDYERPKLELPASYGEPGVNEAAAEVRPDWWKLYNDPQLDQLVVSAFERNADLRMAAARIEETDANLREAGAALFPEVDLNFTPNRSRISPNTATPIPSGVPLSRTDYRMTLSTTFEIDFWGKLRRGQEAARALALGSRYGRDVVALSLAGLVSQGYFALRSLDAQVAVTRSSLATREETLDMVRRRLAGGIASELDLAQAEGARADAAAQLKDLARQRALIEHQLATLAGRLELALPAGELLTLPVPPVPPAGLPSTLLGRRPDLRQAEEQLVAANAQIGIARAQQLPTVSLTGYLGSESATLSKFLGGGSGIFLLGLGLAQPIFDAGRYQARTDAAVARQRQAAASYQKSVETAFREVADALTNLRQSTASEEDYAARAQAARRALAAARTRYESGYSAYLEVLDAQRTANDAELAYLRNRQARLAASVDLMKALGGGWKDAKLVDTP
jgi:multidrug efflux system outer membrane protein